MIVLSASEVQYFALFEILKKQKFEMVKNVLLIWARWLISWRHSGQGCDESDHDGCIEKRFRFLRYEYEYWKIQIRKKEPIQNNFFCGVIFKEFYDDKYLLLCAIEKKTSNWYVNITSPVTHCRFILNQPISS